MTLRIWTCSLALLIGACSDGPSNPASHPGGGGSDGGSPDASSEQPPVFSEEERSLLAELAPAELPPPPPDVSNDWSDDPAAAQLGSLLFFEDAFSGALLDVDNDGGPNSLGTKGETGVVSCGGCHMPNSGFSDTRSTFQEISLGAGWTTRRSPSLLDVGQAKMIMWGGRHSTLYAQIFGPIENPLEMNSSRLFVAQQINALYRAEYEAVFGEDSLAALDDEARFPPLSPETTGCRLTQDLDHPRTQPPDPIYECRGIPGDGADYDGMTEADRDLVTRVVVNAGKAIAAYERTLRCGPGRFDAFVNGDPNALTPSEQRGLKVFIGPGKCVSCHSGPYLSDQQFHNLGVEERPTREDIFNGNDRGAAADLPLAIADPLGIAGVYSDGDDGRLPGEITAEHEGAFRTPTLRCVAQRPTYMHSGLLQTLEQVVAFFDRGGDPSGYPGVSVLEPLGLDLEQRRDLVAFLKSLDGT